MVAPMRTSDPADPIAAVVHPDPYPYYSRLARETPLYRDASLGLWVASGAAVVEESLAFDGALTVRPAGEPVPKAVAGSAAGDAFGRFVRMRDGAAVRPLRRAVSATLAGLDARAVLEVARGRARHLRAGQARGVGDFDEFLLRLPVLVVAELLGVREDRIDVVAGWTRDYVAGVSPAAGAVEAARSVEAATGLLDVLAGSTGGLPDALRHEMAESAAAGGGEKDVLANALGFLVQAYEATAGWIGNAIVALGRRAELLARVRSEPARLGPVLAEVLRWDPPVQNTRRFVNSPVRFAGAPLETGDTVLVVLAAANRDPAANPRPDDFAPDRENPTTFTFGAGVHACPGHGLAAVVARAGVERLIADGADMAGAASRATYRPSANTRIPLFGRGSPR